LPSGNGFAALLPKIGLGRGAPTLVAKAAAASEAPMDFLSCPANVFDAEHAFPSYKIPQI